jgi:hypothetical protein
MEDLYKKVAIDLSSQFDQGKGKKNVQTVPVKEQDKKFQLLHSKSLHHEAQSHSDKKSKLVSVVGGKPVASALAFKPRQTSTVKISEPKAAIPLHTSQKSEGKVVSSQASSFTDSSVSVVPSSNSNSIAFDRQLSQEKEKEEFNTHSSFDVDDPYDPRAPNDYFRYCEEREEQKRIKYMVEENQRNLEEIERQRLMMEKQKKELIEQKDYQKLIELSAEGERGPSSAAGRGRGRGVVNLPSWMTQQSTTSTVNTSEVNQEEIDLEDDGPRFEDSSERLPVVPPSSSSSSSVGVKRKSSVTNQPSRVLLLTNLALSHSTTMNSFLVSEIRIQCEKHGKVLLFDVHNNVNNSKEVGAKAFVKFENEDAAVLAMK